jgi:hypothetical protein
MQSWADLQLGILKARHPAWDTWYDSKLPGSLGCWWCARRKGEQQSSIRVDSPEALTAAIEAAEAAEPGQCAG